MEVYGSKITIAEAFDDILSENDHLSEARLKAFNKITRCKFEWESSLACLRNLDVCKKLLDPIEKGYSILNEIVTYWG